MTTIPDILSWPQLPKRSFYERSFVQSAIGFPGLVVDTLTEQVYVDRTKAEQALDNVSFAYLTGSKTSGKVADTYVSGLFELLRIPKDWFEGVAIKSQLIGPISLGLYLTDEQQRSLIYDPMLLEALAQHLSLRVAWLSAQLSNLTDNLIICLHEPFLDAFHSSFLPIDWDRAIELLEIVFAGVRGCRGVAIGSNGNWTQKTSSSAYWVPILDSSVELLAFNTYHQNNTVLDGAKVIADFLERPGFLTWGLIPTDKDTLSTETTESLCQRFQTLLQSLTERGLSQEKLLHASLIGTDGSLDHLPIPVAEKALQLCTEVSLRLRLVYGLEN